MRSGTVVDEELFQCHLQMAAPKDQQFVARGAARSVQCRSSVPCMSSLGEPGSALDDLDTVLVLARQAISPGRSPTDN